MHSIDIHEKLVDWTPRKNIFMKYEFFPEYL